MKRAIENALNIVNNVGKASFVRKLPHKLRMAIKEKEKRNIALTSGPPTGTTSLVAGTTSGIEPLFAKAYTRKDNVTKDGRVYVHPVYAEYMSKRGKLPKWFVDAHDIKPEEHLDMLVTALKYVDSNISKTCNLPRWNNDQTIE